MASVEEEPHVGRDQFCIVVRCGRTLRSLAEHGSRVRWEVHLDRDVPRFWGGVAVLQDGSEILYSRDPAGFWRVRPGASPERIEVPRAPRKLRVPVTIDAVVAVFEESGDWTTPYLWARSVGGEGWSRHQLPPDFIGRAVRADATGLWVAGARVKLRSGEQTRRAALYLLPARQSEAIPVTLPIRLDWFRETSCVGVHTEAGRIVVIWESALLENWDKVAVGPRPWRASRFPDGVAACRLRSNGVVVVTRRGNISRVGGSPLRRRHRLGRVSLPSPGFFVSSAVIGEREIFGHLTRGRQYEPVQPDEFFLWRDGRTEKLPVILDPDTDVVATYAASP